MAPITVTAEVACAAQDVYAYTTDPAHFAEWQDGVVSGRMEPGAPGQLARCVMSRRIGFAQRASTSELIRADPPHSWTVRGIDGPIRARVDVTVTHLDSTKSEVTIAVDFEGHGIGKLLVPLVRRQARREMPTNIAALKHRVEASA